MAWTSQKMLKISGNSAPRVLVMSQTSMQNNVDPTQIKRVSAFFHFIGMGDFMMNASSKKSKSFSSLFIDVQSETSPERLMESTVLYILI